MINKTVLMSSARYFDDSQAINPYMDATVSINLALAEQEHNGVKAALQSAGIKVIQVDAPEGCQDGVYTANWALVRGNKAVMSRLPPGRTEEEAYAEQVLRDLGKEIIKVPDNLRFSGQGDALPCGNYLFSGTNYRTDPDVHKFLADTLGYEVIGVQTVPELDDFGQEVTNSYSGWPNSFFYDLDLSLSVLRSDLIAWCPEAFLPASQDILRALPIDKIEVSFEEAVQGFACNLVSTGETVIMSAHAPNFQAAVEARGLKTITPEISELAKGGGYIRCTSLTLDNLAA
jgi:N-dimethylarginine dimethylaminohydrolase